ncbi:hypothetical protein GGR53DRAFT_19160 [Hypoxylon sp. FL1150]|nr:hypothetical protein GGR53DRAFT_19160 [Hypoxylon sp. FL1150]
MYLSKIFSLPSSLLVLLAAATLSQAQHPTAIRKMSPDEGEKFMPEYYAFGPASPPSQKNLHLAREAAGLLAPDEEELLLSGNSSAAIPFLPPYPRHYDYRSAELKARTGRRGVRDEGGDKKRQETEARSESGSLGLYRRAREVLAKLQGRQFACPDGTHSCTNIDQPDYCCQTDTTCFVVTNAPDAGNVGCCPEGANCGVTVGTCTDGATTCPASLGGGCCISGFVCAEVGCVASTVSVVTPSQTQTKTQTVTSTVISSPSPTTQVITVIVTVTPSGGGEPVTSTTTQTTTAEDTGTGTATSTTTTITGGGIPPYRPTSGSSTTTAEATSSSSYCPTGFYACVASAGGGCCRTGRDCSTTSCPAPAMTTIVSNGATIAVPVTDAEAAGSALASSTCASGWFLCGSDAGSVPGCCPSGYNCGTASCTLSTSTATATVQKQLPNSAPGSRDARVPSMVVLLTALLLAAVLA